MSPTDSSQAVLCASDSRLTAKVHETIPPLERIFGGVDRHVANDEIDLSVARYRVSLSSDVEIPATQDDQMSESCAWYRERETL